jgi:hypothetical protein
MCLGTQGQLGDCWLLGAMASAAAHEGGLIQNLFLTDDSEFLGVGIMACQFFKACRRGSHV